MSRSEVAALIKHDLRLFTKHYNEKQTPADVIFSDMGRWFDWHVGVQKILSYDMEWMDEITLICSFVPSDNQNAVYGWSGDFPYLFIDIDPPFVSDYDRAMKGI